MSSPLSRRCYFLSNSGVGYASLGLARLPPRKLELQPIRFIFDCARSLPRYHPSTMALRMLPPLSRLFAPGSGISPSFTLPIAITVPPLLADLWESVLRAVPKNKTSHMKKRHRQMAGKALKDVQALNKCPACGQIKRSHLLCPHCVKGTPWQSRISRQSMLRVSMFGCLGFSDMHSFSFIQFRYADGPQDIKQSWQSAQAA